MGVEADGYRADALEAIIENGRAEPVTFTRATYDEHDSSLLEKPEGEPITYECYAAPLNKMVKTNDDSNILTTVKLLYIPATDVNGDDIIPLKGDTVELETTYQVLEILNNFETESVPCAYLLRIGK